MKIVKEKTKFHTYALESKYSPELVNYCQYLKSTLGWKEFSWDSENKKWRFTDPAVMWMIKNRYPVVDIELEIWEELAREEEFKKSTEVIKKAEVSTIEIKGIKGNLYEYQKIGVEFLLNSGGRALLADSPGVGKTAQALAYIVHAEHKRNLIVCPASVKFIWESEIKKWTDLSSFVVGPQTNLKDLDRNINCVIVNYDILGKFYSEFIKDEWNCFVVDECHMIKTLSAIRTKIVKSLSRHIPNAILLTGTPVLSRPIEVFNTLSIIDPAVWNNYYSFAVRYCEGRQGYYGFDVKGASNLNELKQRISKYYLRRTKEEVLPELPPKNRIDVPIDLPEASREVYDIAERDLLRYLRMYKENMTEEEMARSMQGEKLVRLNYLREINVMGKLSAAEELIDNIIKSDEKVLVFSGYNSPLKELEKIYKKKAVLLLGETPVEERQKIVEKFQNNLNTQIFLGGTKSAGVGITLTAASNVIFLDLPWNPADLEQSENRAHRPGAKYECLNIYQIISRDTIDGFMQKLLKRKQEIIDQLIEDNSEKSEESEVDDYIKSLEAKYKNNEQN